MHGITQAAIEAIGGGEADDWRLRPERHAADMRPEAGALKRILERADFADLIAVYNAGDRAAGAYQARFKLLAGWSAALSFLSILSASALLIVFGFDRSNHPLIITALQIAAGGGVALSFVLSLIGSTLRPFEKWMTARAEAEHARATLFNEVVAAEETPREGELPLAPLKLEYVRRYQLDVQRHYYGGRGEQHRAAVRRSALWRLIALLLVVGAAVPFIASLLGVSWRELLGLGRDFADAASAPELETRVFVGLSLIGGALQGLLAARLLMGQDERNATRYAATLSNLEALSKRPLDEARAAAVDGRSEALLGFVALVQEQISSEHREWVSLRKVSPELSLSHLQKMSLPRLA